MDLLSKRGARPFALIALLSLLAGLPAPAQQITRDPRYPAHWWTPVIDPKKPDWEILPQEAGPGEVILSKRNELGLLELCGDAVCISGG